MSEREDARGLEVIDDGPHRLIGSRQDSAYLVFEDSEKRAPSLDEALARAAAVVRVPRDALFPVDALATLEQLGRAMWEQELSFKENDYSSYAEAVLRILAHRPLYAAEKRRACAVHAEVMKGHEAWEFDEVIDRNCADGWIRPEDDPSGKSRPAVRICADWKSLCRR